MPALVKVRFSSIGDWYGQVEFEGMEQSLTNEEGKHVRDDPGGGLLLEGRERVKAGLERMLDCITHYEYEDGWW